MNKFLFLFLFFGLAVNAQIQIGSNLSGDNSNDLFGKSVAISADGTIIAVGATGANSGRGAVSIFERLNNQWVQKGNTLTGIATGDSYGESVAISDSGLIVAVGAPFNDDNGDNSGHVSVYEFQGSSWVQIGQTILGEAVNDNSGSSISLSADGSILAIGALNNSQTAAFAGHVKIFSYNGSLWTQQGQDIDGSVSSQFLGERLALSSDGSRIVIGSPGSSNFTGAFQVFDLTNNQWSQLGMTVLGEAELDQLGRGIAISDNGNIIAVGGRRNDGAALNAGHVRVYEIIGTNWVQIGSDIDGDAEFDFSGIDLALSSDGSVLAVGASGSDVGGVDSGQVKIYQNQNNQWIQIGSSINGSLASDASGSAVAINSNGTTLIIGAQGNSSNTGQVRIFSLDTLLSTNEFVQNRTVLYPNPARTQFIVKLENNNRLKAIRIYNMQGQLILQSNSNVINTERFGSGVYSVEIDTDIGTSLKKLIIK